MGKAVRLSDFAAMTLEQRADALDDLVVAASQPANGGLERLEAEISGYEARYEMSSEELLRRLANGSQDETGEVASWLIRLDLRRRIRERQARTQ
jgi:hypothetical protein